jgi:hypothetical protein
MVSAREGPAAGDGRVSNEICRGEVEISTIQVYYVSHSRNTSQAVHYRFVNIYHFVNACPVKENKDVTKSSYKKTIEKNHIRETDWSGRSGRPGNNFFLSRPPDLALGHQKWTCSRTSWEEE